MTLVCGRFWLGGLNSRAPGSSHPGNWWLLCPGELAERLEGQKVKASVHQPLPLWQTLLPLTLAEEMIKAAGSVADSWSTSTAGQRRPLILDSSYWWLIDWSSDAFIHLFVPHAYLSPLQVCGVSLRLCQAWRKLKRLRSLKQVARCDMSDYAATWDPGGCHGRDQRWPLGRVTPSWQTMAVPLDRFDIKSEKKQKQKLFFWLYCCKWVTPQI